MTEPALQTKGLSVWYGGNQALRDVDLAVASGTLVAVAGSNGAGKSTLVGAVAGWFRARAKVGGDVLLDGHSIAAVPAHRRVGRGVVLVPEGRGAFDGLTVTENLSLVSPPSDPAAAGRVFSEAEIFELFPNLRARAAARCGSLSGGERQMLAVSRALRAGPRVLILDEPSVGLAPRLVSDLLTRIRTLVDRGLSVLLVEQNVRAVLDVADELYLLERGAVTASGTAGEMRGDERIAAAYLGALRE